MSWLGCLDDAATQKRFRFILALGDGLTTSFRSEWASALVCQVALRALVEGGPDVPPRDLAKNAFDEAGRSLGRLADELTRDPEASCPPGQFVSTWKYILKKGALFQTTLTLAWLDCHFLRIAMVGDGGAVWRGQHSPPHGQQRGPRPGAVRFGSPPGLRPGSGRPERAGVRLLARGETQRPLPVRAPYGRCGARIGRQPEGVARRVGRSCKPRAWRTPLAGSSNKRSKNARRILTTT